MGMSISAKLVAGARYEDLVEERMDTETVTRYHEVTGVPYQTTVQTRRTYNCGNPLPAGGHVLSLLRTVDYLDLHVDGSEDDARTVIGVLVAEAESEYGSGAAVAVVPRRKIEEAEARAAAGLAKLGWAGPVGLFLIQYASY